jgi:hypothetical protein
MTGRNKALMLLIAASVLAIYNFAVFSVFSTKTAVFWPAWAFTTFGLLLSFGVVAYCVGKKSAALKDIFFNWPLIYVSLGYAAAQFALSFIVLAALESSPTAANLSQAALLTLYVILSASAVIGGNVAENIDKKQMDATFFIKDLTSDIERLATRVRDTAARNKLQELYEAARYSDPISHESLSPVESEIREKFGELRSFVSDEKDIPSLREKIEMLCDEINTLLGDRNSKCKFLKS